MLQPASIDVINLLYQIAVILPIISINNLEGSSLNRCGQADSSCKFMSRVLDNLINAYEFQVRRDVIPTLRPYLLARSIVN